MVEIAKLLITAAVGSTPGAGGNAIPASVNIIPKQVPIIPNPKAKSPNNKTDFLSLKKLYELKAPAVNRYDGNKTNIKEKRSQSEPMPPVSAEPTTQTKSKQKTDRTIFIYFILSFIIIF